MSTCISDEIIDRMAGGVKTELKRTYPFELISGTRTLECSLLTMGDSYKAGHFKMYNDAKMMCAYGEFREPMKLASDGGINDERIVVYGMRYIIEQIISRPISAEDVKIAGEFYSKHGVGGTEYEYPKEMFEEIKELGHFPVKIEALPEGSVVLPHTPVFIITAEGKFSKFCTFLETVLTMVWYPSCVATLSRHTKTLIENAFDKSVDDDMLFLLDSRLHDFGFRGCTCVEQSVIGGSAHLLNFSGSDTMSACFHVQYHLNDGKEVGSSIPATEHSVMTSWTNEIGALTNLIDQYPRKMIACVMDSYDYDVALEKILPAVRERVVKSGCTLILRPDSGNPVIQVLKALKAAVKAGFTCEENINKKGFYKLKNVAVIQGDGINYHTVKEILDQVHAAGFSAANVAFGMGGGLLQKVNRDTLSFATKLSYIEYDDKVSHGDGKSTEPRNVMKDPKDHPEKRSLPGRMVVMHKKGGFDGHYVFTLGVSELSHIKEHFQNSMKVVYDCGKLDPDYMHEKFDDFKLRLQKEWKACPSCSRDNFPLDESILSLQSETHKKLDAMKISGIPENFRNS